MDFFIIIDSASATQSVTSEGSVIIAREKDKTGIMIFSDNFFFFFFFWIFETFNPNLGLWRENLPPLLPLPVIPK